MISELTYKILACNEIRDDLLVKDSIDWAIEMLQLGYETPSLLMLAGCSYSEMYYEVSEYISSAVSELGLRMRAGEEAVVFYSYSYIKRMAQGTDVRAALRKVFKAYDHNDINSKLLGDFYLLYYAWSDLDWEDMEHNHFWEGARRSNIEGIVIDEAKKWLKANERLVAIAL